MLKFDNPVTAKSGERVTKIWNELQECWAIYKKARVNSDYGVMREYAKKIIELQDDLGITKTEFP
jgi:Zn-dependent M32 family carboxypeptidase